MGLGQVTAATRRATPCHPGHYGDSRSKGMSVTSWRDGASQQAQADLDGLLSAALNFAQHLLAEHHEFYPFAGGVTTKGEVELIAGRGADASDDKPSSESVLASCEAILQSRRAELRAAALVADVRTSASEAIQVDLEHTEGPALRVLLPYTRHRLGRVKGYGDLLASEGQRRVWTSDQA